MPQNPDKRRLAQVVDIAILIYLVFLATFSYVLGFDTPAKRRFLSIFFFRYTRLIVNTISWTLARPWPTSLSGPRPEEATVVIPTADSTLPEIKRCILSALTSGASKVMLVTFGDDNIQHANHIRDGLGEIQQSKFEVLDSKFGNKRHQMICGINRVCTPYVVFCDDSVFWPSANFLRCALAPFEDPDIAGVGTNKRVLREHHSSFGASLSNFLLCVYLDRHNMETIATNRIDGGVWVISGRTSIYRTEIVKRRHFIDSFTNEFIWSPFGIRGPLNADDDLFISRYMARNNHKLYFQTGEDALMYTSINKSWSQYNDKLLRWIRGPHGRSNPRSLLEFQLFQYPWTFYAAHVGLCINFALVWDGVLIWGLYRAISNTHRAVALGMMSVWIMCSKLIKLMPHLRRNPSDILFLPIYYTFVYYMSFLKAYGMSTYWNIAWGSRKNVVDKPPAIT